MIEWLWFYSLAPSFGVFHGAVQSEITKGAQLSMIQERGVPMVFTSIGALFMWGHLVSRLIFQEKTDVVWGSQMFQGSPR